MFFCLLCFSSSLIIYWGVFFLLTLSFLAGLSLHGGSPLVLYNYFVLQESAGLLFLSGLSQSSQFVALCIKVGVSPFHLWALYLHVFISPFMLIWFLVWSKGVLLPLFPLLAEGVWGVVCGGLFLVLLQMIGVTSLPSLALLASTESFSWVLLYGVLSLSGYWLVSLGYLLALSVSLGAATESAYLDLSSVALFLGLPHTLSFAVKYSSLVSAGGLSSIFPLFLLPFSFLGVLWLGFALLLHSRVSSVFSGFFTPLLLCVAVVLVAY